MEHILWIVVGLIAATVVIFVGSYIIIKREMRIATLGQQIPGVGLVKDDRNG